MQRGGFKRITAVLFCLLMVGCKSKEDHTRNALSEIAPEKQGVEWLPPAHSDYQDSAWTTIHGPYADNVLCLLNLSNGWLLAGTTHSIVLSTDRGSTWKLSYNPDRSITELRYDTSGNILALAGNANISRVYVSSDQGLSWRTTPLPSDSDWNQIFISESGSFLVWQKYEVLYHSGDLGKSWTTAHLPPHAGQFYAVGFTRSGEAITISTTHKILYSKDDGRSWKVIGKGFPYGIERIDILGNGDFLICTSPNYRSTDRGRSWIGLPPAEKFRVLSVPHPKEGRLFAASAAKGLIESLDYGNTWTSLGAVGYNITSMALEGDTSLLIGTYGRGLCRLNIATRQWSQVTAGWYPAVVENAVFDRKGTLFGIAQNGIYRLESDGLTWTSARHIDTGPDRGSAFADRHNRLFLTTDYFVLWTSDQGQTWDNWAIKGPDSVLLQPNCLAQDSSEVIYAGTDEEGVLASPVMQLSAANRTAQYISGFEGQMEGLCFDQASNAFYCIRIDLEPIEGLHMGDERLGSLWKSTDSCRTWKRLLPEEWKVSCLTTSPSGVVVVGTDTNGVLVSTDGGMNWRPAGLDVVAIQQVMAVDSVSFVAVGYQSVFTTVDAGRSWKEIYSAAKDNRGGVEFSIFGPDRHLYVGDWKLGLLRSKQTFPELMNSTH